jgi:hypothetical protein
MKGLEEYIKVHGRHFTEELAYEAVGQKWKAAQIAKVAQSRVYYNVTESTLGDMTFLTNFKGKQHSLSQAVNWALAIIGDFFLMENPFNSWVEIFAERDDFDFTPYI